jgi:hypothetical protein
MVGVNKFDHAASYHLVFTKRVCSTCLLVATRLHGFMQEDLVIVGGGRGLCPPCSAAAPHVGTMDTSTLDSLSQSGKPSATTQLWTASGPQASRLPKKGAIGSRGVGSCQSPTQA